jgi:hypothetical protein
MESHFKNNVLKLRSPANKFTRANVVNKDYNNKITHFDVSNKRNLEITKEVKEENSMRNVFSMPHLRKKKFVQNKNAKQIAEDIETKMLK